MVTVNTSKTGQTYLSGVTSSTFDSSTLINAAVQAKLAPQRRVEDQISTNTKRISGYQNLQSLSQTLQSSLDAFRSALYGTNSNVFSAPQVSYGTSDGSDAGNILTATATVEAALGKHTVVVNSLAKAFAARGTAQSSATTNLNANGSFDIVESGGTVATINVAAGDTLSSIRDKINAQSLATGVTADVLQVASGQYQLVIKGRDTAQSVTVSNINGNNVLANLGVTDTSGNFLDVYQPPSPASITLDGLALTSNTDQFDNVLAGLSLDLKSAAPGTTVTLNVESNTTGVKDALQKLVDAYNALQSQITLNQQKDANGAPVNGAQLPDDQLNLSLGRSLASIISGSYSTTSGQYSNLSGIGLNLDAKGKLSIDSTALNTALNNNFKDVQEIFSTANSGVGDQLYNLLNDNITGSSSPLATTLSQVQDQNTALKQKSDDIADQVSVFEAGLIERYSKLQAAIARAQTLQKTLVALLNGDNNNNN